MATHQHQPYLTSTPIASYPGLDNSNNNSNNHSSRTPSWDDHYFVERGRSRSSRKGTTSRSTRPRSADARPQYHGNTSGNRTNYNRNHIQFSNGKSPRCFDKVFYQQEEDRARVAVQQQTAPTYYPSQLPAVSGIYHTETLYDSHLPQSPRRDYRRSLSPAIQRSKSDPYADGYGSSHHHHHHNHNNAHTMKYPYPYQQPQPPSMLNTPRSAQNDLLMYGELDSVTTGQSQQELLNSNKKQRDSSRERRKEKKKIVNLPTSLFNAQSPREQQQQQQHRIQQRALDPSLQEQRPQFDPQQQRQQQQQQQQEQQPPNVRPYRREEIESKGSQENTEIPPLSYEQIPKEKGWRSSMVKRLQTGGSKKRWRIIPSLSRSRSQSPGRNKQKSLLPQQQHQQQQRNPAVDDIGSTATSSHDSDPLEEDSRPLPPPSETTMSPHPNYNSSDNGVEATEWDIAQFKPAKDLNLKETGNTVDFGSITPSRLSSDEPHAAAPSNDGFDFQSPDDSFGLNRSFETTGNGSTGNGSSAYSSSSASSKPLSYKQFTPKSKIAKYAMSRSKNPDFSNPETYTHFDPFEDEDRAQVDTSNIPFSPYESNSFVPPPPKDRSGAFPKLEPTTTVVQQSTPSSFEKTVNNNINNNNNNNGNTRHRSKISPTSVTDMSNTSVRWSENLDQSPTPSRRYIERPKSILRRGRSRSDNSSVDCPSDETMPTSASKSVRITVKSSDNSVGTDSFGFVDTHGRALSPIPSNSFDEVDTPSDESPAVVADRRQQQLAPRWKDNSFEKSLPPEYQEAFYKENSSLKKDDDSGMISDAYVEFIEAVASVVVQTAARQFLARAKLRKLRRQKAEEVARNEAEHLARLKAEQRALQEAKQRHQAEQRARQETENLARQQAEQRARLEAEHRARTQSAMSARSQPPAQTYRVVSAPLQDPHDHHFEHTNQDLERLIFDLAAVRIQCAFRGWFARDCITVDHYCACIIQKNFRAHRCRKHYQRDLHRIARVQTFVRQRLALEDAATRLYCIIAIQAAFRGYSVRKCVRPLLQGMGHLDRAATVLQTQWRSFRDEMDFLRMYESILLIQCVVRGWRTRRRLKFNNRGGQVSPGRSSTHTEDYKLPTNYFGHMEFMRKNLSFSREEEEEDATSQPVEAPSQPSPVGMTGRAARVEIERRRKDKEEKRKAMEAEEHRRKEEHAAHAAELNERRRRMEIKAREKQQQRSPARGFNPGSAPTPPPSDSGAAQREVVTSRGAAADERNSAQTVESNGGRANGFKPVATRTPVSSMNNARLTSPGRVPNLGTANKLPPATSVRSFPEENTEASAVDQAETSSSVVDVPSNKKSLSIQEECASSGASRILAGWRAREKSQSGGKNGVTTPNSSSLGNSPLLKSKGSTDGVETRSSVSNVTVSSSVVSAHGEQRRTRNSWPPSPNRPEVIAQDFQSPSSSLPNRQLTPQRDFEASKKNNVQRQSPSTPATSSRAENNDAERRDRIMDSLGIGPSFDVNESLVTSGDEDENEDSDIVASRRAAPPVSGSPRQSNPAAQNLQPLHTRSRSREEDSPPRPSSTSKYHALMTEKRSPSEQERLDKIHSVFWRVGLMSREKGAAPNSVVDTVQMPDVTVQTDYSISPANIEHNVESEPSASDILKSWRGRDQTQPKMRGKLF